MDFIERTSDGEKSSVEEALEKLADSIRNLPQDRKEELEKLVNSEVDCERE
jgi:hypothetical protein